MPLSLYNPVHFLKEQHSAVWNVSILWRSSLNLKFLLCIIKNKKYSFFTKPRPCMRLSYSPHNLEASWPLWLRSHTLPNFRPLSLQLPYPYTHCFGVSLFEGIFEYLTELYSSFHLQYIWLKRHSWPRHYYQYCSCRHKSTLQNIKKETHRCLAMRCAINL